MVWTDEPNTTLEFDRPGMLAKVYAPTTVTEFEIVTL